MNATLQNIRQLIKQHDNLPLVIAYSGGVDSQVLLHLIYQLAKQSQSFPLVHVCHVHHGLSPHADAWAAFAEQQCRKYGFKCSVANVVLDKTSNESLEAQAREARYLALQQVCEQPSLIFTGHHLDDQAETLLLALKRGAGLKGLSAMTQLSTLNKDKLARPLLTESRQTIESYANKHNLSWVEDESNSDCSFDRNFLRNQVLPLIQQRWPSFNQTVARSAELCQENQQLVDELASIDLVEVSADNDSLLLEPLLALSRARFNNLIRYVIAVQKGVMPSQAQLEQLYSQLAAEQDRAPAIKLGNLVARRYNGCLYLTPDYQELGEVEYHVDLSVLEQGQPQVELNLPDNLGRLVFTMQGDNDEMGGAQCQAFSLAALNTPLSVRFSHQNPTISPDYRQHSRPLKKVLQEIKIAPWQRKRVPFLFASEQLIAVPNYFVCKPFLANKQQNPVFVRWLAT